MDFATIHSIKVAEHFSSSHRTPKGNSPVLPKDVWDPVETGAKSVRDGVQSSPGRLPEISGMF